MTDGLEVVILPENEWPPDMRRLAQAVELLERSLEALDPDCYLDLCAEIAAFIRTQA